jgi:aspartyl/asparaginyl-tRNA synthetase
MGRRPAVGARALAHRKIERYAKRPVIVLNYPKDIEGFYMRLNDDGRTVAAMDVLAPGIGEIIGGSQREERLAVLDMRIEECGIDREHYAWCRLAGASSRGRRRSFLHAGPATIRGLS